MDPYFYQRYEITSSWHRVVPRLLGCSEDQAHEQNNQLVKGSGGAVELTENPSAFRRWMVTGFEQARLLVEFESQFMDTADQNCLQHEHSCSTQATFK